MCNTLYHDSNVLLYSANKKGKMMKRRYKFTNERYGFTNDIYRAWIFGRELPGRRKIVPSSSASSLLLIKLNVAHLLYMTDSLEHAQ
ncbi:MAG: hypothetical protein ACQERC_01520 [Bacteroidota bacterium]